MMAILLAGFWDAVQDVLWALMPLIVFFLLFNFISLKLPAKELSKILRSLSLVFFGLILFLHGVNIGFISAGGAIGQTLGALQYNWLLIPIGFLLGFVVTFAEPAIQILNIEVEKVSGGYIKSKLMLYFMSIGVALAVALSMIRILTGISLWYFLVPGYLLAFILIRFVKPIFVAIAFDSGGVVTGPMIATFILALTVGSSYAVEGSNPITDGFGMIALVAMVPILSVLILGVLYGNK